MTSYRNSSSHSQGNPLKSKGSPYKVSAASSHFRILLVPRQSISTAKMPTPESAMFLAKKPKVPPTFDGVDYDDTKALKAAQDAIIREQWVKSMMARLIREELGKCYHREGVNHLEKCGALRGMFPWYLAGARLYVKWKTRVRIRMKLLTGAFDREIL